jgi:hypothetical protein
MLVMASAASAAPRKDCALTEAAEQALLAGESIGGRIGGAMEGDDLTARVDQ